MKRKTERRQDRKIGNKELGFYKNNTHCQPLPFYQTDRRAKVDSICHARRTASPPQTHNLND